MDEVFFCEEWHKMSKCRTVIIESTQVVVQPAGTVARAGALAIFAVKAVLTAIEHRVPLAALGGCKDFVFR